jgi:hypothetical protein
MLKNPHYHPMQIPGQCSGCICNRFTTPQLKLPGAEHDRLRAKLIDANFKRNPCRVEGFSKKSPILLPMSGHFMRSTPDFSAIDRLRIERTSSQKNPIWSVNPF